MSKKKTSKSARGTSIAIFENDVNRMIAIEAYNLGYKACLADTKELIRAQSDFYLWVNRAEMAAFAVFENTDNARYLPKDVLRLKFEGKINQLSGAVNELMAAAKRLHIDVITEWPELFQRTEAIIGAITLINDGNIPAGLDELQQLSKQTPGFEVPSHIRAQVNQGGAPGKSELQELYDLAYPLFLEEGREWAKITRKLWSLIQSTDKADRNEKQSIVYQEWQPMDFRQRKEQIRHLFNGFSKVEGV